MILSGMAISTVLWANPRSAYVWIVLFVTLGFGAIGFYDDYLKVTKQSHKGFSGRARLGGEAGIAILAAYFMMCASASGAGDLVRRFPRTPSSRPSPPAAPATKLAAPFIHGWIVDLAWLFLPFAGFVVVGAGNAVNLTDGLDGLAIVPVMIAAATFAIIAYLAGNEIFAHYLGINYVPGAGELTVMCGAVIGAGLGFLWFNAPPAQIFMGDTGSLALGGMLGAIAVAVKHEIVLAIVGGLFVMEAFSVIVQVGSFKMTGKRVFKMAPIHHHFEQLGWSEPQVVVRFWIVAFVLALIGPDHIEGALMIPVTTFNGRAVALFGLGGSGLATAHALVAGGALLHAWDDVAAPAKRPRPRAWRVLFDLNHADWARSRGAGAGAGRAADPSRAALDRLAGRNRRASKSSATSSCSAASARPMRRSAR